MIFFIPSSAAPHKQDSQVIFTWLYSSSCVATFYHNGCDLQILIYSVYAFNVGIYLQCVKNDTIFCENCPNSLIYVFMYEASQLIQYVLFKLQSTVHSTVSVFLNLCKKENNCFYSKIYLVLGEFAHLIHQDKYEKVVLSQ